MYALKRCRYILLLITVCLINTAHAQLKSAPYEISVGLGVSNYMGDLTPSVMGSFKKIKPAFSIAGSKMVSNYMSLRMQILHSTVNCNDAWYTTPAYRALRNFKFSTVLTELSMTGVYNIAGTNLETNYQPRMMPYITAGIALSKTNIKRDWSQTSPIFFSLKSNNEQNLATDISHTPPRYMVAFPMGLGIRSALNNQWSMTLEGQYRLLLTDYLDGFSYAANPQERDGYYTIQAGIVYRWGKSGSVKCPRKP